MKKLLPVLLFLLVGVFSGCPSQQCLVRDPSVYRTEMDFMEQAAMQPVDALAEFISHHCTCEGGKFTTENCRAAADKVVTVRSRVPWHKAMALYLGGLEKTRPAKEPPVIPAPETLCPGE